MDLADLLLADTAAEAGAVIGDDTVYIYSLRSSRFVCGIGGGAFLLLFGIGE